MHSNIGPLGNIKKMNWICPVHKGHLRQRSNLVELTSTEDCSVVLESDMGSREENIVLTRLPHSLESCISGLKN